MHTRKQSNRTHVKVHIFCSRHPQSKVNGQKLETVTSFKYLCSVITDESSKPEILSRTAQTTAALTRLKPVWNDRSISLSSKIRLMHSLVTSIFLFACASWTPQRSFKEEYKPWKWGATSRYYAFHTKTLLPMKKSVPRSSRQLDNIRSPDHHKETQTAVVLSCFPFIRSWPEPSCKAQ